MKIWIGDARRCYEVPTERSDSSSELVLESVVFARANTEEDERTGVFEGFTPQ